MTEEPLTPNTDDIGARARTAVGWRALSQFSSQGIQIVVGIILARLLMPSDFGIIGMAGIVTGLAGVFQDLGFGQALVQRAELRPEHSRSAFWMTLIMGTLLYTALYFGAPWAGEYFHDERMVPVLRLMALSFLISPFGVVPRSLLQRELDFRKPFYAGLAGTIANGGVGITMALLGYGYWSLVWALLVSSAVGTIALCIVTRYAPPAVPSLRGARELFAFGGGVTLLGLLGAVTSQVDYFVVGRVLNAAALGTYTRAYQLVQYPMTLATGCFGTVLFSAFSRLQSDLPRFREAYGKTLAFLALATLPPLALMGISAPELIPFVLGEQWQGAVLPFQILCSVGLQWVIGGPAATVLKALGHVHALILVQSVNLISVGIGAWLGAHWGVVGTAMGVAVAYIVILTPVAVMMSVRLFGFGLRSHLVALRSATIATVCCSVAALLSRWAGESLGQSAIVVLLLTVGIGGVVACLVCVALPFAETRAFRREVAGMYHASRQLIAALGGASIG